MVASLVYLGLQIRAQIRQQRKLAVDKQTEHWLNALETQTYPEVAAIWTKGLTVGFDALELQEKAQFASIVGRILKITEGFYLSYRAGDLDAELWQGQNAMLTDLMTNIGVQAVWSARQHWYSADFCRHVQSILTGGPGHALFSELAVQ